MGDAPLLDKIGKAEDAYRDVDRGNTFWRGHSTDEVVDQSLVQGELPFSGKDGEGLGCG